MSHGQEMGGVVLGHDELVARGLAVQAAQLLVSQFFPALKRFGGYQEAIDKYVGHRGLYAIVEENGSVPGAALLNSNDTLPSGSARQFQEGEVRLSLIAVSASQRGSGVGSRLLGGVEQDAAARLGASWITLSASLGDSVPASEREGATRRLRRFYIRNRYTPDSEDPNRFAKRLQ